MLPTKSAKTTGPIAATLRTQRLRRLANVVVLGVIAGVFAALMVLVIGTVRAEQAERQQVELTNDVLVQLRAIERATLMAETGQRGYFITLDQRYLAPYVDARQSLDQAIAQLRTSLGSSTTARQRALISEIEATSRVKFAELDRSVSQIRNGQIMDARIGILSNDGQIAMTRLRAAIAELEAIETTILTAAQEETAKQEARLLPLLGALVLVLMLTLGFGYLLLRQTAVAQVKASQADALAEARDRAALLANELNHRVKNLFAVVLAIVSMTGRKDPAAKQTIEDISARIRALLTAHDVTQGKGAANSGSLTDLIEATVAPYKSRDHHFVSSGPDVQLSSRQATSLGLVLHEMATNAVKYGAWSDAGTIAVDWERTGDDVVIEWKERRDEPLEQSGSEGFGSLLMTSSAKQLGGTIERRFEPDGAQISIRFPVNDRQGSLDTSS